jgi:hypothetical protein
MMGFVFCEPELRILRESAEDNARDMRQAVNQTWTPRSMTHDVVLSREIWMSPAYQDKDRRYAGGAQTDAATRGWLDVGAKDAPTKSSKTPNNQNHPCLDFRVLSGAGFRH